MEFDEIVMKESPGLCRCCLSEGCYKDMGTEYAWMNENEVYADMLLECFDISISQHHDGPNGPNRLICEVCITRLRDACYFKKQVLDSEKKFIDMVGRGEFRPKAMIIYQQDLKAETSDEVKVIFEPENAEVLEEEYLEDEMEFGDDEPLKSEDPEPTSSDVTAVPLPVRGKRGRPRKTPAKPEKKKVKTEPKAKSSKALVKGKRRKMCIGRYTRDAMRLRRARANKPADLKGLESIRELVLKENDAQNEQRETEAETGKKRKKAADKKLKRITSMPKSSAEKTAYQFAKPIVSATSTPKAYNQKVQQHLAFSDLGIAIEQKNVETDASRQDILHHMKLAMKRVRLGRNS